MNAAKRTQYFPDQHGVILKTREKSKMYGIKNFSWDFHIPVCDREFDLECMRLTPNASDLTGLELQSFLLQAIASWHRLS